MPDARVQLSIEIETTGADQLTALRRELEALRSTAAAALAPLDASLAGVVTRLQESRQVVGALEPVFRNFFQSLLGQAGNFRDAFRRLLRDLLELFLRTVARMLAAWIGGLQQMSDIWKEFLKSLGGGGGLTFQPQIVFAGIPGFQHGGLVEDIFRRMQSSQSRLLAFLHRGEAVLNAGAVQLLGPARVESLNRAGRSAPSFQSGGFVGARGAEPGAPSVTVNFAPGSIVSPGDPRAVAAEVIRQIRRRARDQGSRLPL